MANLIKITPCKTYATEANAVKAVEKVFPAEKALNLHYTIILDIETKRFFPLFFGERALQFGAHHHFNVAG